MSNKHSKPHNNPWNKYTTNNYRNSAITEDEYWQRIEGDKEDYPTPIPKKIDSFKKLKKIIYNNAGLITLITINIIQLWLIIWIFTRQS